MKYHCRVFKIVFIHIEFIEFWHIPININKYQNIIVNVCLNTYDGVKSKLIQSGNEKKKMNKKYNINIKVKTDISINSVTSNKIINKKWLDPK